MRGDEGRLGATPIADGTRFEVWAPDASTVEIVFDGGRTLSLAPTVPGGSRRRGARNRGGAALR